MKGEDVSDLTLTLGEAAPGDYPVEVYVLESGDGPQARRSLVLRVEAAGSQAYATCGGRHGLGLRPSRCDAKRARRRRRAHRSGRVRRAA